MTRPLDAINDRHNQNRSPAPNRGLPSKTKQAFKDECDINNIVARYKRTGAIDHFAEHGPQYGDFTGPTFTDAMNTVTAANRMFQDLPANLRKRFENDPVQFLDFVQDPANAEEMYQLGLADIRTQPGYMPNRPEDPVRPEHAQGNPDPGTPDDPPGPQGDTPGDT